MFTDAFACLLNEPNRYLLIGNEQNFLSTMLDVSVLDSHLCLEQVRNEKARRYLSSMRKKPRVPLLQKFPSADPLATSLLERLLAFDPKDRPTAEQVRK